MPRVVFFYLEAQASLPQTRPIRRKIILYSVVIAQLLWYSNMKCLVCKTDAMIDARSSYFAQHRVHEDGPDDRDIPKETVRQKKRHCVCKNEGVWI